MTEWVAMMDRLKSLLVQAIHIDVSPDVVTLRFRMRQPRRNVTRNTGVMQGRAAFPEGTVALCGRKKR